MSRGAAAPEAFALAASAELPVDSRHTGHDRTCADRLHAKLPSTNVMLEQDELRNVIAYIPAALRRSRSFDAAFLDL